MTEHKTSGLEDALGKSRRSGAEIVLDTLNELGVEYIFGHTGGAVIPFHTELSRRMKKGEKTPKFILFRQEGGAGHAAEGYSAASGKVAVALATSGPGATNLVTTIADAHLDSRPVVFLTGQVNKNLIGTDAFQEVDITGITCPITKHNYLVKEPDDLGWVLRQAFGLASAGRYGPVLVDICKNALIETSSNGHESKSLPPYNHHTKIYHTKMDEKLADLLIHEMLSSKRPVILGGGGVINSDTSNELSQFAKKYNIPITLTFRGLGATSYDSPLFLGMAGMHGTPTANYTLRDSDFILAIGTRLNDRVAVKDFGNGKKIAHVDVDTVELCKNIRADYTLLADAKDFLEHALKFNASRVNDTSEWLKTINSWRMESGVPLKYSDGGECIKPQYLIQQISELTRGEAIITTGVGQHQMWTAQYYNFKHPRQLISSGGLGTMGFGLPAAIGAYFADPSKQIVCIDGDGSFQMNMQEMGTLQQYGIPIKVFIINNGYLGMVRQWEDAFYGGYHSETCLSRTPDCDPACIDAKICENLNPDFVEFSRPYRGIKTLRITKKDEVRNGVSKALESKKPFIVDVWVSRTEDVKPIIPPGGSINDMVY